MDAKRIEQIRKEASDERRTLRGGDSHSSHFACLCLELIGHASRLEAHASKTSMAPHTFAQMVNRVRDLAFDFGTTEQFRDRVSELLGEYVDDRLPRVPERKAVEESGPVPDYTGECSAWVPPVGARAVVVPEPREKSVLDSIRANQGGAAT